MPDPNTWMEKFSIKRCIMPGSSLSLELLILHCMTDSREGISNSYEISVLNEIGMNELQAENLRSECGLKNPGEPGTDLQTYVRLMGPPLKSKILTSGVPEMCLGAIGNYFPLLLWPHLYWVIYYKETDPPHMWLEGFQNQSELWFKQFDPAAVRVGIWTRSELTKLADNEKIIFGWAHRSILQLQFGSHVYEGIFAYGLLIGWKRIS